MTIKYVNHHLPLTNELEGTEQGFCGISMATQTKMIPLPMLLFFF